MNLRAPGGWGFQKGKDVLPTVIPFFPAYHPLSSFLLSIHVGEMHLGANASAPCARAGYHRQDQYGGYARANSRFQR